MKTALFPCALGNIFAGRAVGAFDNLHSWEVRTQLTDSPVFGGVRVIHLLGTLGGNSNGLSHKIDLVETLIHFHKLLSILQRLD